MALLLEPLTGATGTRKEGKIIPGIFEKIDTAIEAKGNTVIFHLLALFPPCWASLPTQPVRFLTKTGVLKTAAGTLKKPMPQSLTVLIQVKNSIIIRQTGPVPTTKKNGNREKR